MIIGVRAHDFGKTSPEELARRISAKGFACIQLAPGKAIAGIDTGPGRLSPGLARYICGVFAEQDISIAVLGCYVNLIHPDPAERARLLGQFKEHLRYARDFGTSIVGTETGSVKADYSFDPANHGEEALQSLIASVAELVAEAEKFGVFVCIEPVATHTVSTPARMRRVLDAIGSQNLQVILDPVNLITEENYKQADDLIKESFDLFGERIVVIHSKDFVIAEGRKQLVPVGQGRLNHELLLGLIKKHKPYINLLLEGADPARVHESVIFLRKVYERV